MADDLPWSLRWLAIRTTDWVHEVRTAALAAITPASVEAIIDHAPLLLSLGRTRSRAGSLAAWLDERLADPRAIELLIAAINNPDRAVRRLAWRQLGRLAPESVPPRLATALRDDDVSIRLWATAQLGTLDEAHHAELARVLVRDPVGRLRVRGLAYLFSVNPPDGEELAKDALTDRAAVVRRVAQEELRRRGIDPHAAYVAMLGSDPAPPLVLGLGETGATAQEVEPHLASQRAPVRRAAVWAMAQVDPNRLEANADALLDDDATGVTNTFLRAVSKPRLPAALVPAVERAAQLDERPPVRAAALTALRTHRWRWLAAAVRALDDFEEGVRARAREDVDAWIKASATFTRAPTEEERLNVETVLSRLDPERRRRVEFVLRTSA